MAEFQSYIQWTAKKKIKKKYSQSLSQILGVINRNCPPVEKLDNTTSVASSQNINYGNVEFLDAEMLSPISEAIYSATYVDNYLDSVENLPDDVQRCLSRIRDIDVQYRGLLRDVDHYYDLWKTLQNSNDATMVRRTRAIARMQQGLIQAQELGDEKMGIVNQLQELIDQKTRQLDTDQKNLDIKEDVQRSDQLQDDCGPTPIKHSRAQSPTRGVDQGLGSINGGCSGSSIGGGGGGSTPNSERSSNGVVNGINSSHSTVSGGERSINKRSRRRNENVGSSNIELGGNESNSANEGGGSNGPNPLQKSGSSSGAQKKIAGLSQLGTATSVVSGTGSASVGGGTGSGSGNNSGKKKKRKARGGQSSAQVNAREETPPPDAIDPDEPTYCICNQISFGEMILCDNDLCPIEWFHFSCVSLVLKPKGKWFCPNCRGDRPNIMKPKAQFLKELERFNKEKEGG